MKCSQLSLLIILGFSLMACDLFWISENTKTNSGPQDFIASNHRSGPAPLAVIFDATAMTSSNVSQPFHDMKYTWDFGDSVSEKFWTYGAKPGTVSKNSDRGPIAGHLFETPGTYTVNLSAFDGVQTKEASLTIVVTDPNLDYPGELTICIGQSSLPLATDPGVPLGAKLLQADTWSEVINQIVPGHRIMLRRGDSWDCSVTLKVPVEASILPTRIEAFGLGAPPTIKISTATFPFYVVSPQSTYEFFNLNFLGTENVVTNGINGSSEKGVTVVNCSMDLVASPIKLGGDDLFIQDNTFQDMLSRTVTYTTYPGNTGRGNLGIWLANSERVAILGNRINNATAIEHVVRTQGAGKAVYAHNSLQGPAATKHALAIRGKVDVQGLSKTWPFETKFVLVQDNLIESGSVSTDRLVQVGPQAGVYQEVITDVIIEGNRLSGEWTSGIYSEVAARLTVRNNVFYSTTDGATGLSIGYSNTNGVPPSSDTRFDHNSLYFTGTKVSGCLQYSTITQLAGLVVRGNLFYAPNGIRSSLNNGVPTIYVGNVPAENFTLGINSSDNQVKSDSPWAVLPPITINDWKPKPTSYAIDGGTPVPLWDDFTGVLRTGAYDLGALQP